MLYFCAFHCKEPLSLHQKNIGAVEQRVEFLIKYDINFKSVDGDGKCGQIEFQLDFSVFSWRGRGTFFDHEERLLF